MAITLNSQQRRRRRRNSLGSRRLTLEGIRKRRRKEPLQRWMDPFDKNRRNQTSRIIIIDSSDDESAAQSPSSSFDKSPSRVMDEKSNDVVYAEGGRTKGNIIDIDDSSNLEDESAKHIDDEDRTMNEKPFKRIYFCDVLHDGSIGTKQCEAITSGGHTCRNCALETMDYCRLHGSYDKVKKVLESTNTSTSDDSITDSLVEVLDADLEKNSGRKKFSSLDEFDFDGDESILEASALKGRKKCSALTLRGKPCSLNARKDSSFCRRHDNHSLDEFDFDGDESILEASALKGRKKCSALTLRGKPCSLNARKDSSFCRRHENHSLSTKKESPRTGRVGIEQNDKLFTGKKRQFRCTALSGTGQLCPYQSASKATYCFWHTELNQASLQDSSPTKSYGSDSETASAESSINENADSDRDSDSELSYEEEGDTIAGPYKFKEFMKMWHGCEEYFGEMTDEIESTRRVRGANSRMSPEDTDGQLKAQYGRLLPRAMKKLMTEILELSKEDTFLDIGHGIGNACIQAAFTFGCEARGIEVVYDRNSVAEVFRDNLDSQNKDNPLSRLVGQIILRHGRLENEQHQDFLTGGVTRAYVNNFNGVFAERSSKGNQKWFLDDYVAGLFALMASGTIMVTLHPLNLGPTKSEANKSRKKQGLTENENASFYEVEKILLGKACDTVKWNQHSGNQQNIYVYKYTRVSQPSPEIVFLCCNPTCKIAKGEVPIPATTKNEEGRVVINHCECRVTAKNLRRQRRKVYK